MLPDVIQDKKKRYFRREYLEMCNSPWLSLSHRSQGDFFKYCVTTVCGVHWVYYDMRVRKHFESRNNIF